MRRLLTATAVAAALVTAACGGGTSGTSGTSGGTPKAEKVTVGVIPIVDVAPIYLGKQQGFFSERGIDLDLVQAQSGAAIVPAVISGQYQFGFSNMTPLIIARSKGLALKVVTAGNYSTGKPGGDFGAIVVKNSSPIKSAKDLAGRTVAVNNLKNIGDTTVRESVRKAGGDATAVRFVELAFPDMPAAVQNGRVDAAWVVEPFLTIARSQGDRVVAWNFVDTDANLMIAAYFTGSQYEQQHADVVKRFTAAMNESLDYAAGHPDAAREVLKSYTKIPAAVIPKLTLPKWTTDISRSSTEVLADLAVKDGLITQKPNLNQLLP